MPKAVVDSTFTERFDLKSCPDGFVVLRRMSFGEKEKRRELATNQTMRAQAKQQRRGRDGQLPEFDIKMLALRVAQWEFANLIVEHNLEDENGQLLNFKDMNTVNKLDPRIGDEISVHIEEMNNFEEDDQRGNS